MSHDPAKFELMPEAAPAPEKGRVGVLALAPGSAVWVVVQYDQCDWTDYIMQPGYWSREHAETRAKRLNNRETDSYTYRVKEIKMHSSPNIGHEPHARNT